MQGAWFSLERRFSISNITKQSLAASDVAPVDVVQSTVSADQGAAAERQHKTSQRSTVSTDPVLALDTDAVAAEQPQHAASEAAAEEQGKEMAITAEGVASLKPEQVRIAGASPELSEARWDLRDEHWAIAAHEAVPYRSAETIDPTAPHPILELLVDPRNASNLDLGSGCFGIVVKARLRGEEVSVSLLAHAYILRICAGGSQDLTCVFGSESV